MYDLIDPYDELHSESTIVETNSPWLKIYEPRKNARVRLYCFSHIGGGASTYKDWHRHLTDNIEVAAIQLPGREDRSNDRLCQSVDDVLLNIVPFIFQDARPFILFGHSFGSVLAYSLQQELENYELPSLGLIVSAKSAPHVSRQKKRSSLPRIQLIQELKRMGGTPESIFNDSALLDRAMKTIRADFSVLESAQNMVKPIKINSPIAAISAEQDSLVSFESISAWRDYTQLSFELHSVKGDHFYIHSPPESIFSIVSQFAD
ncbi:thioesterase II family protein [Teredinibacter sp. KSP-S5-2]|uniref:thioesterase II family protein n=1 Tax=Teredinibacter sp. KSP-S5-2 TaxID=3034506 RepID=UPI002934DA59|nr:alpha/beta fold hydrolase [Teredinibacter sp. KSP-S5-2]WNO11151.1 alpha/beta fold hydrolase [Teredinibacter sp. KSP-S5-2]